MTDKLTTPRMRVILADGTCHDVQALNVDLIAWDRERGKRRDWPPAQDAPFLWSTYLAWHVLHRTGAYAGAFALFESDALQVDLQVDEDGEDGVDPTRTGAEPG